MPSESGVKNSLLPGVSKKHMNSFQIKKIPRILGIIQQAHNSQRNVSKKKKNEQPWIC